MAKLTPWKNKEKKKLTPWRTPSVKKEHKPGTLPASVFDDETRKNIIDELKDKTTEDADKPGLLGQFWDSLKTNVMRGIEPTISGIGVTADLMSKFPEEVFLQQRGVTGVGAAKDLMEDVLKVKPAEEKVSKVIQDKTIEWGDKIGQKIEKHIRDNEDYTYLEDQAQKWSPDWWARFGGQVAGSMGKFMGPVLVGGLIGGPVGATALGTSSIFVAEGGSAWEEAKKKGASDEEANLVAQKIGGVNAALEFVPIANFLNDVPGGNTIKKQVSKNLLSRLTKIAKTGGRQALAEMTTESAQEVVSNAFLKTFDENKGIFDNIELAALGGLIGGGGIGSINATMGNFIMNNEAVEKVRDLEKNFYEEEGNQKNVSKNIGNIEMDYEVDVDDNVSLDNDVSRIEKMRNKVEDIFDLEGKYKREDVADTGRVVKNIFSKMQAIKQKANEFIKDLNKQYEKKDYTELAFAAQRPAKVSGNLKEMAQKINDWFNEKRDDLKERGWLKKGFMEGVSLIEGRIEELEQQIKKGKTGARTKKDVRAEIKLLKEHASLIEEGKLKYVHIPVQLWFKDMMKKNPRKMSKFFGSSILKTRRSLTLEDFIEVAEEQGLMKKEDVDIRDIIQSYARQYSKIIAIDEVLKQARQDGLIKKPSNLTDQEKETWYKLGSRYGPYANKYAKPFFWNDFESQMGYNRNIGKLESSYQTIVGATKMMAFYNPGFLPMYDIIQGIAGGTLLPKVKTAKAAWQAFKAIKDKSKEYFKAKELGLTSQPFIEDFKSFYDKAIKLKNKQDYGRMLGAAKEIVEPFENGLFKGTVGAALEAGKLPYRLSWNAAWAMDEAIRFVSYFSLKEKGYTSQEAAQRAAQIHGDYASIPKGTRRFLNKFLFTPTFKIAMGKLQLGQAKSFGKVLALKSKDKKELDKSLAFVLMGAMWLARDFFMEKILGLEKDQLFRRYKKKFIDEEGEERELVVTTSGPDLVFWRYFHRYVPDLKESNPIASAFKTAKWELTPLVRVGIEMIVNEGADYNPIFFHNDSSSTKALKRTKYGIRQLIQMTKLIWSHEGEDELEARETAKKEFGRFGELILRPFTFKYVRNSQDRQNAFKLYKLQEEFQTDIRNLRTKNLSNQERREVYEELQENYLERLDDIREVDRNTNVEEEKEKEMEKGLNTNLTPWK